MRIQWFTASRLYRLCFTILLRTGWSSPDRYINTLLSYFRNMLFKATPAIDATQNVVDVSGHVENGITRVKFSRALNTGDADDYNFDGSACANFLFAWGNVSPTGQLLQHSFRAASSMTYCFSNCGTTMPTTRSMSTSSTMRMPTGQMVIIRDVSFMIRITRAWNSNYAVETTMEHLQLKNQLIALVYCTVISPYSSTVTLHCSITRISVILLAKLTS